jgi:hypothetical protein
MTASRWIVIFFVPTRLANFNEMLASGHLARPHASTVTIHHDADHPSHLLLPIIKGNVVGTYFSSGELPPVPKPKP